MPPEPMRMAHVMAGAPSGGAELFFERLCAAFHRAGDQVLAAIRRDTGRAARLREAGLVPAEFRFGGALDLMTGPRLRRCVRAFAPQVVVTWMSRAARFAPTATWPVIGRLGGYYDLRYFRRCDRLVGNTHGLVTWIKAQGWPSERVHYVPNFVPDLFGAQAAERAALGVPPGVPLLLALGRLHRNKAFDVLIRALPEIRAAHLVIAGEGSERAALAALAATLGVASRVHLPGWRQDGDGLMAACDVLVCPSRQEPLGNVVIEGWSARRPVVATRAAGPTELIASGSDGLLVPVEDYLAMAAAITSILENPGAGAGLVAAGRRRFEVEFAEATVVGQWRDFLAGMVRA